MECPEGRCVSPIRRTLETASIIGDIIGLAPQVAEPLTEIDFGTWTGRSFDSLTGDPAWDRWNQARSQHSAPGGESMLAAQCRIASWLQLIAGQQPDQVVVAVSHADVIKAALAHAMGLPLDHHHRFDVDPGSVSVVIAGDWGMKVQSMNERPA